MNAILKGTIVETYVNHIIVKLYDGKRLKVGNKYLKFYPSVKDKVVIYHINNTYKVFKETVAKFNVRKASTLFIVSFSLLYGFSIIVNEANVEIISAMMNDSHEVSKSDMKEKANKIIDNIGLSMDKELDKLNNAITFKK